MKRCQMLQSTQRGIQLLYKLYNAKRCPNQVYSSVIVNVEMYHHLEARCLI